MKFLSASQIREADAYTIKNLPISSIILMEKAASICTDWILNNLNLKDFKINVFCGTGNNGGDGLVIARQLYLKRIEVECFIIGDPSKGSEDFRINKKELEKIGLKPEIIRSEADLSNFNNSADFIIDALLGTGLTRPAEGLIEAVIKLINKSGAKRIAIDLPSGLYVDKKHEPNDIIVKADYTLSFQCPKLNFVLPEYAKFVGEWYVLDIGLIQDFIDKQKSDFELITKNKIVSNFIRREKFSHKGTFGHASIVAGSYGTFGAAIMAVKACLHSGIGLCSIHTAKTGHDILQISCPEAMFHENSGETTIIPLNDYSFFQNKTIGIGPGIGLNTEVKKFLSELLDNHKKPMVFDADALTLFSESKDLLSKVPSGSILTPHPKEFERLFGSFSNDYELIELQQKWTVKLNCIIILKGAHTRISTPDGMIYINSSGNPGMAKGGSGDVLTGILTALLGQGYKPHIAALIGVYVHGYAGDLAASEKGQLGMLPTDIIDQLPTAFKLLKS